MIYANSNLATSLAAYLAPYFPGVMFYPGPNQQGTLPPCMFLQERYSYPELQQDGAAAHPRGPRSHVSGRLQPAEHAAALSSGSGHCST